MAQTSFDMTTYYAKRIIGDNAAETAAQALLQIGSGVTKNTWILHKTGRASNYGIRYKYDYDSTRATPEGAEDKIEFIGKGSVTAWIKLDVGRAYFKDKVGIGTDTFDYKLNVNGGQTYLNYGTASSNAALSS